MQILTKTIAIALWYEALKHEIGLGIEIDPENATQIRNFFYTQRLELKDEDLAVLALALTPGYKELYIIRRTVEVL